VPANLLFSETKIAVEIVGYGKNAAPAPAQLSK
jgi:hypothetical protein